MQTQELKITDTAPLPLNTQGQDPPQAEANDGNKTLSKAQKRAIVAWIDDCQFLKDISNFMKSHRKRKGKTHVAHKGGASQLNLKT